MILTGMGDVRTSKRTNEHSDQADPWYQQTAHAEDPDVLGLAVGNIGVWVARDDLPNRDRGKVEDAS
jgi:hypothetical protein